MQPASLSTLQKGQEITFLEMPQPDVSHSRFRVSDSTHYQFGNEVFTAHTLRKQGETLSLIATPQEFSEKYAIALAKKIDKSLFAALFSGNLPEKWFSFAKGKTITTSNRVMGMQQSWIASEYTLILKEKASIIKEDKQEHFDYLLCLNAEHTLALEAEKYSDGKLVIYSTLYSDESVIEHIDASPKIPLQIVTDKNNIKKETLQEKILLDEKLLEKLQAEARRNRMSLQDLVRKIMDIPAESDDNISPYFILNEEERIKLAKRHAIPVSDSKAIRQKIMDDLNSFIGSKHK